MNDEENSRNIAFDDLRIQPVWIQAVPFLHGQ